jgi:hypothetical protein
VSKGLSPLVAAIVFGATAANAGNDTWIPIGVNKDRIDAAWVQQSSYETLNEYSFRMNFKATDQGRQQTGQIEVNCKNKDYSERGNGIFAKSTSWSPIPSGSAAERLAEIFCKRTSARKNWGYLQEDSYLFDQPPPNDLPGNAKGEWILVSNTDEAESYYNDRVYRLIGFVQVASWVRQKKGDRPAAQPQDTQDFRWMNVSCSANKNSVFLKPDISVEGTWLAPTTGKPGGIEMLVRRKYCN